MRGERDFRRSIPAELDRCCWELDEAVLELLRICLYWYRGGSAAGGREGDVKEGYWINYRTGKEFPVDEHEQWLRSSGNARKLGVPHGVVSMFGNFAPQKARDKFLMFVMANAPVMRARGHGSYATFEYSSRDRQDPMDAVWMWGKRNAGTVHDLRIVNFATKETTEMCSSSSRRPWAREDTTP